MFRSIAFHGRQDGRMGPPTYFYSEVGLQESSWNVIYTVLLFQDVLESEFQVKIIKDWEDKVPVKE